MAWYDNKDFWNVAAPVAQAGLGWYTSSKAEDEAQKRAGQVANDPMAQALEAAARGELGTVGAVDPAARFAQQQALMAPVKAKGEADLFRNLYAKGMMGLATDQGAASGAPGNTGPTWTQGQRANPLAAAYFAAQSGADQRAAYDALKEADAARSSAVNRAASLAGARNAARGEARSNLPATTKSGGFAGMLSSLAPQLPGLVKGLGGLFDGMSGGGGLPTGGYGMPSAGDWGAIEGSIAPVSYGSIAAPQFGMDDLWGDISYDGLGFDWGGGLGGGYDWSF